MTEYIYGVNPAWECLRAGRRRIFSAVLARKSRNRLGKLAAALEKLGVRTEEDEKGRINNLAGTREHQGVALEVSGYPYVSFDELSENGRRLVLLDNIEDPHNVGAVLRSAEFFGYDGVMLPVRGGPGVYPSVVKASAGASEHLRVCHDASANSYARRLRSLGFKIIALDGGGGTRLRDLSLAPGEHFALVVGGEDSSVGQLILNEADAVVAISRQGKVESLNASVAAGVAMGFIATAGGENDG